MKTDFTGKSVDRYQIMEPLGEGGMATVYKAFDTRLEKYVAFKVIRTDKMLVGSVDKSLKRFEREAKALAQLSHPNIIPILDYGNYESQPYLVMEYMPGGTLKAAIENVSLTLQEKINLLLPIIRALGYAHKQGIIHRDVKPANILITASGEPMLTDFGVAKILEIEETADLTGTSLGVGTPEYMAPEQVSRKVIDHRADIYAMGIILYEMVTGRKPYRAETPLAVLLKHASDPLPSPRDFVPNLSESLEHVLLKVLAKDPDNRYQSMAELEKALLSASVEPEKRRVRKKHSTSGGSSRRILAWVLVGIVLVAATIGGASFLLNNSPEPSPTDMPTPLEPLDTPAQVQATLPVPQNTVASTIPTQTFTATPNNVPTAETGNWDATWSLTDSNDNFSNPIADILSAEAMLKDSTLSTTIVLADVPETLTIGTAEDNSLEFGWTLQLDVDQDGKADYELGIQKFQAPGTGQETVSLRDDPTLWAQADMFLLQEDGGLYLPGIDVSARFDPDNDTLSISTTHPALKPGMGIRLVTFAQGEQDSGIFNLPPPPADSQNDFWNVEITQVSDWEIAISFNFSLQSQVSLNNLNFGAMPVGCNWESIAFSPVSPFGYVGEFSDGIRLYLDKPGTCVSDQITLEAFYYPGGTLFTKTFEIPFNLNK